jgi:hypothetical protein
MDNKVCRHEKVIVDYEHPHGLIRDVAVEDLRLKPKEQPRRIIILLNPSCEFCGKSLSKQNIKDRLHQNGDLCDCRFRFVFP